MNSKILKYLNNDKDTEITDSHIIITDQIISKSTDNLSIDANVIFAQDVEFKAEASFNKISAKLIESTVFRNTISELLEEHIKLRNELESINTNVLLDNRINISSDNIIDESNNKIIDTDVDTENKITESVSTESTNNESGKPTLYPDLNNTRTNKIIIGSDNLINTVTVMKQFYDRTFSINEFGNNNDHVLLIGPNISSQYCIFYLIVYFNNDIINALSYSMNKFYYKIGSKKQFVLLNNEYINEENKAEVRYKNGNIEIKFKFNSSEIRSIKIEAYASKC